jgi:hypothetical protein
MTTDDLCIFAVFFGLRVYALCNRSILLFVAVFVLNMVPFGTNMVNRNISCPMLAAQY